MKMLEIIQNDVKVYLIPTSGILYVTKEEITSKNTANIIIIFSGGQIIKMSFPSEQATLVYADIRNVLGGEA